MAKQARAVVTGSGRFYVFYQMALSPVMVTKVINKSTPLSFFGVGSGEMSIISTRTWVLKAPE